MHVARIHISSLLVEDIRVPGFTGDLTAIRRLQVLLCHSPCFSLVWIRAFFLCSLSQFSLTNTLLAFFPIHQISSHRSHLPLCSFPWSNFLFSTFELSNVFLCDAWMPEDSDSASTWQAFYPLATCGNIYLYNIIRLRTLLNRIIRKKG